MTYKSDNISPNNFEECIKCTICTAYCPVSAVNPSYPGPKQAGPDGERYRLKKPSFYDEALKYCLNCKRCEVACPSGVRVGDIIQSARIRYAKSKPSLRDRLLADTDFVGTLSSAFAPIVNPILRTRPVKMLMHSVLGVDSHRQFPAYSRSRFTSWYRRHKQEQEKYPRQVAYFHGCYVEYNNPALGIDFVKIMNALGFGVRLLDKERCCGVAKIANGLIDKARHDAEINIESIRRAGCPVLTTSSTCTLTMREEYPHLLGIDNSDVRESIQLAVRFIFSLVDRGEATLVFRDDIHETIAYHTPCHMSRLGWAIYPVSLLKMAPGLTLRVLPQNCCGIAGTYGFKKENYNVSQQIGQQLFDSIAEFNPDSVATDCETCKWQIEMSTPYKVENPISILARMIDFEKTRLANS